ncbi:hypothetical protein A21D_00019 [Virgibacillus dokdonensis]|uniref:Uncharacterized protein n=1 Tax=Virgibacillus dokdonensis TaxID=302167 RepID=A0A2K9IUJ5_9BACI|nr:hypothetical protein [Virgibacillus dokdonensis]AUJ23135.1 hypothetical protein A21D_00019 [Virgibacillus dokdonensis]
MSKKKWFLLFRFEGEQKVFIYEPLKKYELNARKRQGWKVLG